MIPEQITLDFTQPVTRYEAFLKFHATNPQVFDELEKLARILIEKGRHKFGIGLLFEVLRWEFYIQTSDPESDFKLNNNYRSHYARLLIEKHPEWESNIETRELRSA